jgi:putative NADPH-quinone reductase
MKVLLVVGHPDGSSLNSLLARKIRDRLETGGHEVLFHDLYAEGFDPVLPLEEFKRRSSFDPLPSRHGAELSGAGGLVVVHPDWWGLPPAIVKGWVDRVFLPGVAYAYEEGDVFIPLLGGLRAAAVVTRDGEGGELCRAFWLDRVFGFCGIKEKKFVDLGPLRGMDGFRRGELAEAAAKEAAALFAD